MKKVIYLLILIVVIVLPCSVLADSKSSGNSTPGTSGTCGGDTCDAGWMNSRSFGGIRITVVDSKGKAVSEAGGKSYDFATKAKYNVSLYRNVYGGDKSKLALGWQYSESYNFAQEKVSWPSSVYMFGELVGKWNYYIEKEREALAGKTDEVSLGKLAALKTSALGNGGLTGGNLMDGWRQELDWFLSLTVEGTPVYTENVNSFMRALGDLAGFNSEDMLLKMANCSSEGGEIFIIFEPLYDWAYHHGGGSYTHFVGTMADAYAFNLSGVYGIRGLWSNTKDSRAVYYQTPIVEFNEAADPMPSDYKISQATDMRSKVGFSLAVDWANNPAAYNCGSCDFYPVDTVAEEDFASLIGTKKDWALVVNNKLYSKTVFNDFSGTPTELFPSIFPTIAHYAFASEDDQGANCCEDLTPEDFTNMKNGGFWDEAEVADWQQVYDDTCYESCDIYKIVDDSGAKHYGLFYDRNVYGDDSLASLSLPARYKEIQVYPSKFEHLSEYAYSYAVEGGAGCCNDLTADEIQVAVDNGYMSPGEAAKWAKTYEEMCDPTCKFYFNDEDNDWGILYNYEVYSNSSGGPAGFGSLAEFAYTEAPGGAGCCSSINIAQIFQKYKDGLMSDAEFNEWYLAYYELCDDPPDCCMMAPFIVPGHIEGDVNNCCEETHSEAKEYELDDLFCYDIDLKVNYYLPKCDVEYYLDDKANLNDYCEMYCTERVTVDTPEPITAINGRYFTMKVNPVGNTTSVYIEGFKRCRMRIFYDKWEQDYYDTVDQEKEIYNKIQYLRSQEYLYNLAVPTETTVDGTVNMSASSYTRECYESDGETVCVITCTDSDTDSYDYSYSKWEFPETKKDYYTIKINEDDRNKDATIFDAIWLEHDSIPNYQHAKYSTYDLASEISNANSVLSSLISSLSCETKSGDRGDLPDEGKGYPNENVPVVLSGIRGQISAETGNYNATARAAKELEKQIDVCTDYFTEHDGFLYPEQHYDFQATQEFYYYQVYLDDMGELKEDYIYVDWKDEPGCIVTGPFIGGEDPSDEEIKEPRYSEIYDSGVEKMTDMAEAEVIELQTSTNGYKQYLDEKYEAKKQFTHDAKYKVVCEWEEEENQLFTLVPNGFSTTEATTTNFTVHERQYRVFLTTLEGQYETFWDVKGLGEMQADGTGKFDEFFEENGVTCAEEPAKDATLFTCKLEVNHSLVITGICNGTNGSDTNHDIDDCDPYKEMYRLFTFKIVDPANLFPTNPDYDIEADSAEYAYNWLVDEEGRAALDVIEARGQEDLTYAIDNLTYSFTLTPEDMRHIKNYNETREINGGYSDFELDCVCPEVANPTDGCIQCKSTFIANLANGRISYSGRSYDMTGWANERETLGQVRDGNNW